MCGSGSIAIEASLIASDTAPGLLKYNNNRNPIRWKDVNQKLFEKCFKEAKERDKRLSLPQLVIANDKDLEIEKLKKQLKELKKETEKTTKNKNLTKEPEINLE